MDSGLDQKIATLRRIPLLNGLSDSELKPFANCLSRREENAGAVIFVEGDVCKEFIVVEEGEVRLEKSSASGRRQLLAIERKGSVLAEVAVLDGGRYPATAEAATQVSLLQLPAETFRQICVRNPELVRKVFQVLVQRLRHLVALVEELSFSTIRSRLIAHLARLADDSGTRTLEGVEFQLCENNEELAARLGTVRELVSRNLGRLHSQHLIRMRGRTVTIPDIAALRREIDRSS